MSDKEFWQAVYIAAIRAGYTNDTAQRSAAVAVENLRRLTGWLNGVTE